jgi:NitT/TauT family transport system ATP-binding protein
VANIEFRDISKSFSSRSGHVVALSKLSLSIADQQLVTIVGASGCGKSTLLNMLAGFDTPTTGRILVDGRDVSGPGPDRGVVFQQTALFPWLTVEQNIAFGLKLRANALQAGSESDIVRSVDALLQRTGLAAFRHRWPSELSGGMRQRAAIASVLAINPKVLLMDEPFGALDSLTRTVMQDFLLELWEADRKTVLLVTHDIDEAIYLADKTIVMSGHPGRVREIIDVDLPRPRHFDMHSDPRFIALRDKVRDVVRGEATQGATAEA